MLSVTAQLKEVVNELKSSKAVDAAAVIRRDGVLMASNFQHPSQIKDVFAMMTATIIGAAKNITTKNAIGVPNKIT
ncbi:MAG: roadblock/LC7 domain-containing protein, partial [Thermoplasmata archaeon]